MFHLRMSGVQFYVISLGGGGGGGGGGGRVDESISKFQTLGSFWSSMYSNKYHILGVLSFISSQVNHAKHWRVNIDALVIVAASRASGSVEAS